MKLSENILQKLKNKSIQFNDLNNIYFIDYVDALDDHKKPFRELFVEAKNILDLLDANICSFREIVDKFKELKDTIDDKCLYMLLSNRELFRKLLQSDRLTKEDLKYTLMKCDEHDMYIIGQYRDLAIKVLNKFVLDKELVDRLNEIIETTKHGAFHGLRTIFDLIQKYNKNNEEIMKLNELNKVMYVFDLTEKQKLDVFELIQNNEIAKNRLKHIVNSHLEDLYDFESLMDYLKKKEKKSVLNI